MCRSSEPSGAIPCGDGRCPLRRVVPFPVRGFDFPCTRVWVYLYEGLGFPVRANRLPYTGYAFSLHGVAAFPTRRFWIPYTEQEGVQMRRTYLMWEVDYETCIGEMEDLETN